MITKSLVSCSDELSKLSLYFDGIDQVITTNDLIVNELKTQMQKFMERVGNVETSKQETE
jgi:uncharacterized coiled-coil protein SlyX